MKFQQVLSLLIATVVVAYDDAEETPSASLRGKNVNANGASAGGSDFDSLIVNDDQKRRKTQTLPWGLIPPEEFFINPSKGTRPPISFPTSQPTPARLPEAPEPTPGPTPNPTPDPTPNPVVVPETPQPTPGPTPNPTPDPTPNPVAVPETPQPTPGPTPNPTPDPTPNPVAVPETPQPTPDPTPNPTPDPTPNPTDPPIDAPLPAIPIREETFDSNGNRCGMSTPGTVILHGGIFNYEDPMSDSLGQTLVQEMRSTPDGLLLEPLVFLPGARRDVTVEDEIEFENQWQNIMFPGVPFSVLHPNDAEPDFTNVADAAQADTLSFAAPLRNAGGVFLPGGRQWRLIDAYKYTQTEEELWYVLDRGGVIAGTSAGAAVMGDVMPRGDPAGSGILLAEREWYQHGFGFVSNIAIDNHVERRGRENDMYDVLNASPENRYVLGIGLNENTMAVVKGRFFQVRGDSTTDSIVRVYDCSQVSVFDTCNYENAPYLNLTVGSWYDLCDRQEIAWDPTDLQEDLDLRSGAGAYQRPWSFGSDYKAGNPNKFICSGRKCRYTSHAVVVDSQSGYLVRVSGRLYSLGTAFTDSDRITIRYRMNDATWRTLFLSSSSSSSASPFGQSVVTALPAPPGESLLQIQIEAETAVEGNAEFQLADLTLQ